MKKIAWLVALVVSLGSALLLVRHQRQMAEELSGGEKIAVLVAARDLSIGESLQEGSFALREIPESYLDPRHIRADELVKATQIPLTTALHSSEAILWTDLAIRADQGRSLAGLIKSGMRAVSVRVDQDSSIGALMRPGDRVDLLLRKEEAAGFVSIPVLQNIQVLAVGGRIDSKNIVASIQGASSITLSVTAKQAQLLGLAQEEGSLSAILRSPSDVIVSDSLARVSLLELMGEDESVNGRPENYRREKETTKTRKAIEHVR